MYLTEFHGYLGVLWKKKSKKGGKEQMEGRGTMMGHNMATNELIEPVIGPRSESWPLTYLFIY